MHKDTTERFEKLYLEKLKTKTDTERAAMGFSMFETSRYLIKADLPLDAMTPQEIKIAIFNRFYGNDFDRKTKEKIVQYLGKVHNVKS